MALVIGPWDQVLWISYSVYDKSLTFDKIRVTGQLSGHFNSVRTYSAVTKFIECYVKFK